MNVRWILHWNLLPIIQLAIFIDTSYISILLDMYELFYIFSGNLGQCWNSHWCWSRNRHFDSAWRNHCLLSSQKYERRTLLCLKNCNYDLIFSGLPSDDKILPFSEIVLFSQQTKFLSCESNRKKNILIWLE